MRIKSIIRIRKAYIAMAKLNTWDDVKQKYPSITDEETVLQFIDLFKKKVSRNTSTIYELVA